MITQYKLETSSHFCAKAGELEIYKWAIRFIFVIFTQLENLDKNFEEEN